MAEETAVVDAAPIADSSSTPVRTGSSSDALKGLTPTERHEWRKTGTIPDAKTAASSATEPVKGAPRKEARAEENRVPDLLKDRATERERAERAERERDEWKAKAEASARPPAAAVAPPAAAAVEPKVDAPKIPTVDELMAGGKSYEDAITERAKLLIRADDAAERAAKTAGERAEAVKQENITIAKAWTAKADAMKTEHADYEQVCYQQATPIAKGSVIEAFILDPENEGPTVLYYLQTHQDEVVRINALGPLNQVKALTKLESTLIAPPVEPKVVPKAGEPPKRLGRQPAEAANPVHTAVASNDFRAFNAAEKARRLAANPRGTRTH